MSHINDPCDAVAEFSYATGQNSTAGYDREFNFEYLVTEPEAIHVALYDPIERQYEEIENWADADPKVEDTFYWFLPSPNTVRFVQVNIDEGNITSTYCTTTL